MTINLDIRKMLPIIREAYDNHELQMFQEGKHTGCLYTGPCAIGVCMTPKEREIADCGSDVGGTAIRTLVDFKIITIPEDQQDDIVHLQNLHDNATLYDEEDRQSRIDYFGVLLASLEQKYIDDSSER
jgi:hypothetical protein